MRLKLKEIQEEIKRVNQSEALETEKKAAEKGKAPRQKIVNKTLKTPFSDRANATLPVEWYKVGTDINIKVVTLMQGQADRVKKFLDDHIAEMRENEVLGLILTSRTLSQHATFRSTVCSRSKENDG